jgi:hypothetical protein
MLVQLYIIGHPKGSATAAGAILWAASITYTFINRYISRLE